MSGGTVSPSGYCPGRHFPLAIVSRRQFLRGTLAIRCDTCSENYVELVFICVLLCEGQCAYDIVHQIVSYCPFICLKSTQRWTGGRGVEGGNPLSKNDEKQRHLFTMSRKRLTMIVRLASSAGNSSQLHVFLFDVQLPSEVRCFCRAREIRVWGEGKNKSANGRGKGKLIRWAQRELEGNEANEFFAPWLRTLILSSLHALISHGRQKYRTSLGN